MVVVANDASNKMCADSSWDTIRPPIVAVVARRQRLFFHHHHHHHRRRRRESSSLVWSLLYVSVGHSIMSHPPSDFWQDFAHYRQYEKSCFFCHQSLQFVYRRTAISTRSCQAPALTTRITHQDSFFGVLDSNKESLSTSFGHTQTGHSFVRDRVQSVKEKDKTHSRCIHACIKRPSSDYLNKTRCFFLACNGTNV
jgi:hypothetical protein